MFGSKDKFHGLAIFLDTYPNDETTEVGPYSLIEQDRKGWEVGWGLKLLPGPCTEEPPGIGVVGAPAASKGWAGYRVISILVLARVPVHLGDGEQWLPVLRP